MLSTLSIDLVYRDGKLTTAAPRGDGRVGEDITPNAKVITDIPHELSGTDVHEPSGRVGSWA